MRVSHNKSPAGAVKYFLENQAEYYLAGEQHVPAVWFGRGAATLGLTPDVPVTEHAFRALCYNQHPETGERLTARNRADRRAMTDVTFSAPKSVSVLWAYTADSRIPQAVRAAVLDTMADLEEDAQTRCNHRRGLMTLEPTRNIVGVAWAHTTSRPVDGVPDPQLHVHATVLNCTQLADGAWTAVDLSKAVQSSGYYNALFMSRLATKLQELGYPIERSEHNFEIAGLDRSLLEKFSRRTAQIEARAAEEGLTSKDSLDALGAKTRDAKSAVLVSPDELPQLWHARLTDLDRQQLQQAAAGRPQPAPMLAAAREAVDAAIEHRFERESVTPKRKLAADALIYGIGAASPQQVLAEIQSRDWIGDDDQISTRPVLERERRVVAFARNGRGQVAPLAPHPTLKRDFLSVEQTKAIRGLLGSTNRLQIVSGAAGTGKTTLMHETIEQIESAGSLVTVLAPTAEAAHGVLRDQEGFEAQTLAAFLVDERLQAAAKNGVVWVDESGLVSLADMDRLLQLAGTLNARIILSGDPKQHQPVAAGQPLRQLIEEGGVRPQVIRTIRRQTTDAYRDAVSAFSRGDAVRGFERIDAMGRVHEISDDTERGATLAKTYADAIVAGESALVLSPSNAERRPITEQIRNELKSRSVIVAAGEETVTSMQSRRLTEAQRRDPVNYVPGEDVLEFHRNAEGGFRAGDRVTVAAVKDGRVYASNPQGLVSLPLDSPKAFDVYRRQAIQLAPGDLVRITKNRNVRGEKRLHNGTLLKLLRIADGKLHLSGGVAIDASWGHVDHGIAVTSYGSQGKTVDRIFIAQSAASLTASSAEQAYVSASRGRRQIDWFVDDKEAVKQAIARSREPLTASQLQARTAPPRRRRSLIERAQRYALHQWQRLEQVLRQPAYEQQYAR